MPKYFINKRGLLALTALIWSFALHAQWTDSSGVRRVFHWKVDTLVASSAHDNIYNECWGFVNKGREFAVIGSTAGTHIFDITDPSTAHQVAFIPGAAQGTQIVHRDYHDYKGYLYAVCDEGASTLQIIDITGLPDSFKVVYNSSSVLRRTHNIFIDTSTHKLFAASHTSGTGQFTPMRIFSLADPLNPLAVGSYDPGNEVHDVYVRNDTAYCNNASKGLAIMNFSNPASPVKMGDLINYPDQGYNHSGWLHPSKPIYVFADETHGMRLKVCDVSDPSNIRVISYLSSGVDANSIPHNLIFRDDFVFISYYHDGLYIFNLKDPANPFLAGYFDTYLPGDHERYRGAWGVYPLLPSGRVILSDMQYGLFVFDVSQALATSIDPNRPQTGKLIWRQGADQSYTLTFPQEIESAGEPGTIPLVWVMSTTGKEQALRVTPVVGGTSQVHFQDLSSGLYYYRVKWGSSVYKGSFLFTRSQ